MHLSTKFWMLITSIQKCIKDQTIITHFFFLINFKPSLEWYYLWCKKISHISLKISKIRKFILTEWNCKCKKNCYMDFFGSQCSQLFVLARALAPRISSCTCTRTYNRSCICPVILAKSHLLWEIIKICKTPPCTFFFSS